MLTRRTAACAAAVALGAVLAVATTAHAQTLNVCSSKKKLCVAKKVKALIKCHAKAEKTGVPVDPACLHKARDKFDGGADPAKGCFVKLEQGDCITTGDTAALEAKVDAFVVDVVCELDPAACGVATPTPTPTPVATVTPGGACPSTYTFTTTGNDDIDYGWTGQGHDQTLTTMARLTLAVSSCAGSMTPCGQCSLSGPVANAGGPAFASRRCRGEDGTGNNGSWIACTSDTDCPGAGNGCTFFFGPPQPIAAGGVAKCLTNEIVGPVTGTVNADDGSATLALQLRTQVWGATTLDDPCPRCMAGMCDFGPRAGEACTISGSHPIHGDDSSYDCPPLPSSNVGDSSPMLTLTTGTQTRALSAASPNCRSAGAAGFKCFCDVCNDAAHTPCDDNADCVAVGATICGAGGVGTGVGTRPNECTNDVCTPNTPPDNDSIDEGRCAAGPTEGNCAIQSYRACTIQADCPALGDSCVVADRQCYTDNGAVGGDVAVAGVASSTAPAFGTLFCLEPVASPAVNAAFGLPGLGRMTLRGTATFD